MKVNKVKSVIAFIIALSILLIPQGAYADSSTEYDTRTSTSVVNNKQWKIRFNKELNPSTVSGNTILVQDEQNNRINNTVTLDSDNRTIILNPATPYNDDIKYQVIVTKDVKAKDGKLLKKPIKMKFSIKAVVPTVDDAGYFYNMNSLINKDTKGWTISALKYADGTKGELLETEGYNSSTVETPFKLNGYYKIYIGYASGTSPIEVKKSSSKEYVQVTSDSTYYSGTGYDQQYIYEKFALLDNFNNEGIVIDSKNRKVRIAYIRAVKATDAEIKLYNTENEGAKEKRVIYDNDGYSSFSDGIFPNSESLNTKLAAPLASKNVGILNWTLGTTAMLNYNSKYAGKALESFDKYPSQLRDIDKRAKTQILSILSEGKSPLEFLAEFGEEQNLDVYASLRMAAFYPEDKYGFLNGNIYNSYKDVKQRDGYGFSYFYPKTRDYITNVLKEASSFKYVDGVTLDFCRYPTVMTSEANQDTKIKIMTEFMRRIRKEIPNKKIVVRIPYNNYLSYGFDIKTWIKEGLIDVLVPSNISVDDFFNVKPFVDMVKGTKIKLYIGICADVTGHDLTKEEEQLMKAGLYVHNKTYLSINEYMKRTAEVYAAGADGVFLFNTTYRIYINSSSPKEASMLGDKVAMAKWYYFQYNPKPVVKSVVITKL